MKDLKSHLTKEDEWTVINDRETGSTLHTSFDERLDSNSNIISAYALEGLDEVERDDQICKEYEANEQSSKGDGWFK